jgi:hypothetical protein
MIFFRKYIIYNKPSGLFLLAVILALTVLSQVHNHNTAEEVVNCPAYIAGLFFNAEPAASVTIPQISNYEIITLSQTEYVFRFSFLASVSKRAPPLI